MKASELVMMKKGELLYTAFQKLHETSIKVKGLKCRLERVNKYNYVHVLNCIHYLHYIEATYLSTGFPITLATRRHCLSSLRAVCGSTKDS